MTLYQEDLPTIYYSYLSAILAMEKSQPIRAILLKNPKTDTVIIFRQKKNGGTIKTRRFVLDKPERTFFLNSIARDFPHMELEIMESEQI